MEDKLMHIYYGYGKGKTTSAVGSAYRASGRGMKVLFSAFLKNKNSGEFLADAPFEVDDFHYSERFWKELNDFEKNIEIEKIISRLSSLEGKANEYDMIVLDEFLDIITCGCVDIDFAVEFVRKIYSKCEIIITGHKRVEKIFEMADYITEMRKEKHPYDRGVKAREGVEF